MIILLARGFYHKKRILKSSISATILIILLLTKLRYGSIRFLQILINDLGVILLSTVSLVFIYIFSQNKFNAENKEKKINLAEYDSIKEKDSVLLNMVLNNVQYKVIALNTGLSEGTVRNRLNKLYDILGVADRIGFITTYSDFEIFYDAGNLEQ